MFGVKLGDYSSSSDSDDSENVSRAILCREEQAKNIPGVNHNSNVQFTKKGKVKKRKRYSKSVKERAEETKKKTNLQLQS